MRWTTRWWDPRAGRFEAPSSDIAVYADGTVVGAATVDFAARPMIWPYVRGEIDVATVADLLDAAGRTGLLAPADPVDGNPNVAGAPVTFVDVHTATGSFHHRVHALQTPGDDDTPYLRALRRLVSTLGQLTADALAPDTAPFAEPERVAVVAELVTPDETRGVSDWPVSLDLARAVECTVTDDRDTIAFLQSRLWGEQFAHGDAVYRVVAHQLVPGEPGCLDGDAGRSPDRSTERVVIEITTQASFPVEPPFVGVGPSVVVLADGTVHARFAGAFEVEPMVWPYRRLRLAPEQLDALVRRADEAGLLVPPEPPPMRPEISHPPLTVVVIDSPEGRVRHTAWALDDPPDDESAYLRALREFTWAVAATVEAVDDPAADAWHVPTALAVAAAPADGPDEPQPWPGVVPLAELSECTVLTDPAVIAALADSPAGQRYTDGGATYRVAARVSFSATC